MCIKAIKIIIGSNGQITCCFVLNLCDLNPFLHLDQHQLKTSVLSVWKVSSHFVWVKQNQEKQFLIEAASINVKEDLTRTEAAGYPE